MLRITPAQLDYFQLFKRAKRLDSTGLSQTLRVAVLGDCATQHFVAVLRTLLHDHKIHAEVYEAGFDTVETEVYDANSNLYQFAPDVIVLLQTTQALKARYYGFEGDKSAFATGVTDRISEFWELLGSRTQASIIQSNFVVPHERLFGNFDHKIAGSLGDAVQVINRSLSERSRTHKSVFLNDVDYLAGYFGRSAWSDEKLWTLTKAPCALTLLPRLVQNVVDIALSLRGGGVKCLVLDLDNTLWGGVIGDDGLEGIRLGHLGDGEAFVEFQRFLLELSRRGVILTVCSKNNHEVAIRAFQEHPEMILREKDITVFVANWDDKARNIATIRETLNIGYDSMVFLDDNPFERNLVREMLPEVIVPELPEDPAEYVKTLSELNLFETTAYSALDRERAAMYSTEIQREQVKRRFENIDDYLQSLEMKLTLERFDAFSLPRIAQLSQRSNQFNLATRRYSEAQCDAFMKDEDRCFPFWVSLRDRFGDHGLISVVILKLAEAKIVIDEYLMSCRVLQRGVEQYVMNEIVAFARARGVTEVEGLYRPTAKNAMVKDFYRQFGFVKHAEDDVGNAWWRLDVTSCSDPWPTFIRRVRATDPASEAVKSESPRVEA